MKQINVIFWGAGAECEANISLVPKEWNKVAIIDKDINKRGTIISGIPVLGTNTVAQLVFDYVIITSSKYSFEIKEDIIKLGISPMKIISGDRYNKQATLEENNRYYMNIVQKRLKQMDSMYVFENRSNESDKLFYVLAGYKPALWKNVFERMEKFIPKDIDICLLSSGLYSEELSRIAQKNNWSYLSTSVNDVAIIQNIAISLFNKAKYIYKMDEDIFITDGCCEKMYNILTETGRDYKVGFVGPMIPLHTNGHLFLNRFNLCEKYKEKFGGIHIRGGRWTNPGYGTNPEIPKFLWSQGNIDELNQIVEKDEKSYEITAIKYAICFILFERKLYEEMGGFNVVPETRSAGMNGDEGQLTEFCMNYCRNILVATNTLCGHFSYPGQELEMIDFMNNNRDKFEVSK